MSSLWYFDVRMAQNEHALFGIFSHLVINLNNCVISSLEIKVTVSQMYLRQLPPACMCVCLCACTNTSSYKEAHTCNECTQFREELK